MKEKIRKWFELGLPLTVLALFLILVFTPRDWWVQETKSDLIGQRAPDVVFRMPSGEKTSLSQLTGNVLLLNFWAAWCGPCVYEMPSLKKLEEVLHHQGFMVLALNVDPSEDATNSRVRGIVYPKNLIFDFNREQLAPYNVSSIPVSVLIDAAGIIRKVYMGPRNWDSSKFVAEVNELFLEGKK